MGTSKWSGSLQRKVQESGVHREALWPEGIHEVPVAYNVLTGVATALVLPVSGGRKESWKAAFGDEWVVGTADFVSELLEAPWVDDLKTGRRVAYGDYEYQQGLYCLAWTKFTMGGLCEARSTITHWPKYPISQAPIRFGTVLTPEWFRDLQSRLKQLREDVMRLREFEDSGRRESVVARLSDGPQCIYCPSKLACTKGQKYE